MPDKKPSPVKWSKKRSLLAVIAGFVVTFVVAILFVVFVRSELPNLYPDFHPDSNARGTVGGLLLNLFVTLVAATGGGLVGAVLARHAPVNHGLAVGVVAMFAAFAGGASTSAAQPVWYTLILAFAFVLGGGIGGKLREKQQTRRLQEGDVT